MLSVNRGELDIGEGAWYRAAGMGIEMASAAKTTVSSVYRRGEIISKGARDSS